MEIKEETLIKSLVYLAKEKDRDEIDYEGSYEITFLCNTKKNVADLIRVDRIGDKGIIYDWQDDEGNLASSFVITENVLGGSKI